MSEVKMTAEEIKDLAFNNNHQIAADILVYCITYCHEKQLSEMLPYVEEKLARIDRRWLNKIKTAIDEANYCPPKKKRSMGEIAELIAQGAILTELSQKLLPEEMRWKPEVL